MAEAISNESTNDTSEKSDSPECAVCLQSCVHPAQLPCGHVFCFLCVKGFANQNKKCAMCRQEIPRDFIDQPNLLQHSLDAVQGFDGGYQWFYEGRNGWWQYDERTSKELEFAYKNGEKTCELLIAGFLYVVDLENMLQLRRNDPSRRRRIKRDYGTIPKKGIAGLHIHEVDSHPEEGRPLDSSEEGPLSSSEENTGNAVPITPSNTPQTPINGRESPDNIDLQSTIDRINSLRLESSLNLSDNGNDLNEIN